MESRRKKLAVENSKSLKTGGKGQWEVYSKRLLPMKTDVENPSHPIFSSHTPYFRGALRNAPEADSPCFFVLPAREPSKLRVACFPVILRCRICTVDLGYRYGEAVADLKELERVASLWCWHGHVAFDQVLCCGHKVWIWHVAFGLDRHRRFAFAFCRQWHGLIEFDLCCGHKVWLIENDSQLLT